MSDSVEVASSSIQKKDKITFKLSGVLRFTYNYSDWKEAQKERGGDFGYDVLSLRANAEYNQFFLNADYRLYSDDFGGTYLKHGYFGYRFNENSTIQLGLTQVPFGVTPYNSNSWFFSLACYAGFEDDYDMGLKYTLISEKLDFSFAFFKNAEEYSYGNTSDVSNSRYAYDVGSVDLDNDGKLEYRNKEINQLNAQLFYKYKMGSTEHRLGVSGQYSGLYNLDTEKSGDHYAYALHYEMTSGRLNVKAQGLHYKYNPESPDGEDRNIIAVGAYGAANTLAAEAEIYTIGVCYTLPIKSKVLNSIAFYNDYGYMKKHGSEWSDESQTQVSFEDSQMNVTGIALSAGPIYTYIDYAMGRNHSWLGGDWNTAFGKGDPNAEWEKRFNINIGYYF